MGAGLGFGERRLFRKSGKQQKGGDGQGYAEDLPGLQGFVKLEIAEGSQEDDNRNAVEHSDLREFHLLQNDHPSESCKSVDKETHQKVAIEEGSIGFTGDFQEIVSSNAYSAQGDGYEYRSGVWRHGSKLLSFFSLKLKNFLRFAVIPRFSHGLIGGRLAWM